MLSYMEVCYVNTWLRIKEFLHTIYYQKREEMKDSTIVELTREYQFDRYTFWILTDNKILDCVRKYLAAFYVNSFRQFEIRSRMAREVWKKMKAYR